MFEPPKCENYKISFLLGTHWQSFDVIILEGNHRQGGDHAYAETLNRIRIGQQNEDDIALLETRVRPEGHQDLKGAMYLTGTNVSVQKHNKARLNEMSEELIQVEAINLHSTIKNFKPVTEKKGTVRGTPFLQTLEMKVGCRVMLTYNVDVLDCLTNGARGKLMGLEKGKNKKIIKLFVKFDEECQGEQRRARHPYYNVKYPGCTVIERIMFSYTLGKKSTRGSNVAKIYQFPIVICFAATSHKFQGQTIVKPQKVVIDLRTVFQAAMAYVMLSRVQAISQLFLLGCVPEKKLYPCVKALEEMKRLENKSMNRNPTVWEQENKLNIKISSLNCHSIADKFKDIEADPMLKLSDIICLSETWLKSDQANADFQVEGYKLSLNSVAEGKGLATYYKENIFCHTQNIKRDQMQLSKFTSKELDVISIYRSSKGNGKEFLELIKHFVNDDNKPIVILGDFNFCVTERSIIHQDLKALGFKQIVEEATHFEGGHLNQIYIKNVANADVEVYSPYYTARDHDALCLTVAKLNRRLIKIMIRKYTE